MTNKDSIQQKHLKFIGDNCEHSCYCIREECQSGNSIVCHVDIQTATSCTTVTAEAIEKYNEWLMSTGIVVVLYREEIKPKEATELFLNQKAKI